MTTSITTKTNQPIAFSPMLASAVRNDEKISHPTDCARDQEYYTHTGSSTQCSHQTHQSNCRRQTLRRLIAPLLLSILSLCLLLGMSCLSAGEEVGHVFDKRQNGGSGNGNGNGNVFIDRKYYLIVIIVGIVLVLLMGVCLSAWCCRGAFENPLCCPCYCCACMGGLACLECIGCGLCAEGLEDV